MSLLKKNWENSCRQEQQKSHISYNSSHPVARIIITGAFERRRPVIFAETTCEDMTVIVCLVPVNGCTIGSGLTCLGAGHSVITSVLQICVCSNLRPEICAAIPRGFWAWRRRIRCWGRRWGRRCWNCGSWFHCISCEQNIAALIMVLHNCLSRTDTKGSKSCMGAVALSTVHSELEITKAMSFST